MWLAITVEHDGDVGDVICSAASKEEVMKKAVEVYNQQIIEIAGPDTDTFADWDELKASFDRLSCITLCVVKVNSPVA